MKKLMETNTCNLTNIVWPRRADGGMDYPLPDMSGFQATHITADRLRLRKASNISAQTVTTLEKGAEVQVLETGEEALIDGIRAPWVKVWDGTTGYKGWCFSGYLREIKRAVSEPGVMEPAAAVSIAGEPETGHGGDTKESPAVIEVPAADARSPFRVMLLYICVGILGAAGITAFILAGRKLKS
jgi:hypothetical protein